MAFIWSDRISHQNSGDFKPVPRTSRASCAPPMFAIIQLSDRLLAGMIELLQTSPSVSRCGCNDEVDSDEIHGSCRTNI
jgi:hypothetical protein